MRLTFYEFLDQNKEKFKNTTWTYKRDCYVDHMKGLPKDDTAEDNK